MGYFKEGRTTKKVKLPSDTSGKYWVEIYTDIKWGQSKHALTLNDDGSVDMIMSADKILQLLITDWNLDNEKGEKAEINEESIDKLEPSDAMWLIKEAGGDKVSIEDAKKNSLKS